MKKQLHIRDAKKEDVNRLIDLCALHAAYEKSDYDRTGKAEKLQNALFSGNPMIFCWVVVKGEQIIGYVSLTPQYSTWDAETYLYLDCLFIEEGHRGSGIGATIMKKIKQFCALKGFNQVQWQTPNFNYRAIKFYKREGATSKEKVRFFLEIY